jgi:two-component system, sensor histidine kinase FlrB
MPATCAAQKKDRAPSTAREINSKRSLERAFQTFTHAADSLEKSYGHLHAEVLRLRFELEQTNRDLAASLEENARMKNYLARILECMPCGLLVTDRHGRIQMINPEAKKLVRAPESEYAAQAEGPEVEAVAALSSEALEKYLIVSRSGNGPNEHELSVESPGGKRTIGLTCAVLGEGESDGAASESVFLLRDITEERKQAEERELARRKESLAEMATLLAHEIRNPLGSLELFAGLVADAAGQQPDLRRWTDHIQAGLRTLSATVNNVLQFHSQPAPQLAPVNLGRLLRESVEFLRPLARQAGLRIDLQNSLGELEIPADMHRLQQVFFNLALNAFRAMSVGGKLTLRLRWADLEQLDEVMIEFEDTGKGIAPDDLPKIFLTGFTTHPGNPGLGLAVCQAVLEQHRGKMQVKSEEGKGTTFALILPRVKGAE